MLPGVEMFQYDFMVRAFLVGGLVGAVAGLLGVFLVLRGYGMVGDGLGHVAFGGVAFGLLANIYPLGMALAFAITAAIGIQLLHERGIVLSDTAIAIFFITGLALGVLFIGMAGGFSIDIFSFLFGSVLGIGRHDVGLILGITAAVALGLLLFYKELVYLTYSQEAARVGGVPVGAINVLFAVLTAVTVVMTARFVGVLLVAALLVLPAATTLQFARGFRATLAWSAGLGVAVFAIGLWASWVLDVAPGGAIALASVLLFFLVLAARWAVRRVRPALPRTPKAPVA